MILTAFASVRFSKSVTQARDVAVGSDTDDNGLAHGHAQASEDVMRPMTRNEAKEAKERKKRKLEIQQTMEALIGAVRRDPSLLQQPEFSPLREFGSEILADPLRYPVAQPSCVAGTHTVNPQELPPLTAGLADKLFRREPLSGVGVPSNELPIVQVLQLADTMRKFGNQTVKQYCADVVDGDSKLLAVRFNTALNASMVLIHEGTYLRLIDYVPIYYNYNDKEDLRAFLLVKQFSVVGRADIDSSLVGARPQQFVVTKTPVASSESDESNGEESTSDDSSAKGESVEGCHGQLCSMYGTSFIECITKCIPVNSLVLSDIASNNPFVDRPVEEMTAKQKKHLLFYWYATNVYHITGKGNNAKLPECLEDAIRRRIPEPPGMSLVGFKRSER